MKAYRTMEHRVDDRIVISPAFGSLADIGTLGLMAVDRYDALLSPYGGRLVADKFYRKIALLDAATLKEVAVVFDGYEWII